MCFIVRLQFFTTKKNHNKKDYVEMAQRSKGRKAFSEDERMCMDSVSVYR